jgi:chemotaxis protein histidine kinase CheA
MENQSYQALFVKSASINVAKLKQGIEQFSQGRQEKELRDQVHIAVHSLKGEALAMGYQQFGNFVTVIEKYLKSIKESTEPIPYPHMQLLTAAVEKVEKSFEEVKSKQQDVNLAFETDMLIKQLGVLVET